MIVPPALAAAAPSPRLPQLTDLTTEEALVHCFGPNLVQVSVQLLQTDFADAVLSVLQYLHAVPPGRTLDKYSLGDRFLLVSHVHSTLR